MKVLVAEDDQATRANLCRLVQAEGHEALEAGNGREALAVLLQDGIGLILVDLVMPVMTGLDFIVTARSAGLLKCPVYVVSGFDPLWVEGTGVTGYLSKPVDVEQLRNVLATAELVQADQRSSAPLT